MIKPSLDKWLEEAKLDPMADKCGSYITHTGVVRSTPKSVARGDGYTENTAKTVSAMKFSCDREAVAAATEDIRGLPGIFFVKVWVNEGLLAVGEDIMQIMIGGDIRPRVFDALDRLLTQIKDNCVKEEEVYSDK